jgi:hypothetical protein
MGIPALACNVETLTCYKCGLLFGVPEDWAERRRVDHANFYCPNGHCQGFYGKSAKEKELEAKAKEVENLQRRLTWREEQLENANSVALMLDIGMAIARKAEYNSKRPYRHGGKKA